MPHRKAPPPIIEWVIDPTAEPVRFEDFLETFCAFVESLPDDLDTLLVKTNEHPFSAGSYAFSRVHNRVVRIWSRKGKSLRVTLDLFEERELKTDRVKETDLMAWSDFLNWAPSQPWYVPPTKRDKRALLEHFERIIPQSG